VSSATATGTDPTNRQVSATDDAAYAVLHPALEIAQDAKGPFREGDTVPLAITVTNTGDVALTDVKVSEPCVKAFDSLEPGATQKFDCATTAPQNDVVSTAKATATPPIGPPVTAEDADELDVIHPAVKITQEAKPSTVRAGDDVTFTITVTNAGDVPLTDVKVSESCLKELGTLAAGENRSYGCTEKAPEDDFTATAEVTGMDSTTRSVQSKAEVKVDVVHPEIALMKDATPYEVRAGDTVTFSILVKNTGDVPLTAVSVVDDHTTSCAHTASDLVADAEITYTCKTIAGKEGFTSKATVTGEDPTGRSVTASGEATFEVRSG
jgi:hypothetical protein